MSTKTHLTKVPAFSCSGFRIGYTMKHVPVDDKRFYGVFNDGNQPDEMLHIDTSHLGEKELTELSFVGYNKAVNEALADLPISLASMVESLRPPVVMSIGDLVLYGLDEFHKSLGGTIFNDLLLNEAAYSPFAWLTNVAVPDGKIDLINDVYMLKVEYQSGPAPYVELNHYLSYIRWINPKLAVEVKKYFNL